MNVKDKSRLSVETDLADEDYQPLSGAAMMALALGVLSIGAFFSIYLNIISMLAIILGIVALFRIKGASQRLSGAGFAALGIALAMMFSCASIGYSWTKSDRLYRQANLFAEEWFELIKEGTYTRYTN